MAKETADVGAVLEYAHEAFISIDESGAIRAWNPEAERTFGWSRDDAVGECLRDLIIPPRYRDAHDHGLRRFLETGEGPILRKRLEITALHRDGTEFPVELTISPLQVDGRWTFNAFVHDISDRHRAQELQARLATIVEHSADAIISRSRDGRVTTWNPAAARLYGYTAAEMVGRTLDVLVPPGRGGEAQELFDRALAGEATQDFETQRLTKDGRLVDVALTISPVWDDAGGVAEISLVGRDITARKEVERRLVEANEELKRTNDARTQFIATASHELRTPLTTVAGFVKTLLARWEMFEDADRFRYLEVVGEQTDRLARLVDDVLLLSRIEAAPTTLDAGARTDVVAVVEEVLRSLGERDGVVAAPQRRVLARADRDHVHRMVLNLVTNARAHGGMLAAVEVVAGDDVVEIRVRDEGPGVPDEFVPSLFRAFAQARAAAGGGSGLGLSIVRSLAEAAGGTAWHEPNRPRGACFVVRLPQAT